MNCTVTYDQGVNQPKLMPRSVSGPVLMSVAPFTTEGSGLNCRVGCAVTWAHGAVQARSAAGGHLWVYDTTAARAYANIHGSWYN